MNTVVPRILLDAADVPACTLNPDGVITSLNPAFSRLCGRGTGELVGSHATSLCIESDQAEVLTGLISLLGRHAELAHVEVRLCSVSGTSRRVRLTMAAEPVISDHHATDTPERVTSIAVVGRDLTADRRRNPPVAPDSTPDRGTQPSGAAVSPDLALTVEAARTATLETGRPYAVIELAMTGPALEPADLRLAAATIVDRMRQQLRSHDTIVRHHQGVCTVVATDLGDAQDAAGVCYRLLSTTMEPVVLRGEPVDLKLAAGIAIDDGTSDPDDVVSTARSLETIALSDGGGFRIRALGALAQA